MDLFKALSMKMANSLDWNCRHVCKRCKGDGKRVRRSARRKLKREKGVKWEEIN